MLRCSIHPLMFPCRVVNFNTSFSHAFPSVGVSFPCRLSPFVCTPVLLFTVCPSVSSRLSPNSIFLPLLKYYFFSAVSLICSVNTSLRVWQSIHLCRRCLTLFSHLSGSMCFTGIYFRRALMGKHINTAEQNNANT